MEYLLATLAALVSAVAIVLQRLGLESAPIDEALTPGLFLTVLRRGVWLLGFTLLLVQFVLQASALHFGSLSVVQPILNSELVFLVVILAVVFHHPVGRQEVVGVVAVVAGLAGFFVAASPTAGTGQPDHRAWIAVTSVVATLVAGLVVTGRLGPRWWRAAALGAAAAVLFSYNAGLTKSLTTLISEGWGHVATSWVPYALAVTGACGLLLLQASLHAGPVTASRTANVVIGPLAGIVIGITAFDERLATAGGRVAGAGVSLVLLLVGAAILARSRLVADTGAGAGSELLGPSPIPPPVV